MKYIILLLFFINALNAKVLKIEEVTIINTSSNERSPFLSSDESLLFFSSDNNGNFDNYFVNYNDGEIISSPKLINESELFYGLNSNSSKNEFNGFLSLENKHFYFASDRSDGLGGSDIYFSKQIFNEWKELKSVEAPVNSKYNESSPFLAPDGRTLYFVSNRPGGFGGTDIWYSTYDEFEEKWSIPVNFKEINTEGNESSPFLAPDGKTFFFASDNMLHNMGGKDFYYITKEYDEWKEIEHLQSPINSKGDEDNIIFSRDGSKCIFSSNRAGKYNIYIADLEPLFSSPIELILKAYDEGTGVETTVSFVGFVNGKKIFTKKGESAQVILGEEIFKGKQFVDIEIKANNPILKERTKNLRIFNNQKESRFQVLFVLNESGDPVNMNKLDIPFIEGDFEIITDNSSELKKIVAYETTSSTIKPILNYVFFEQSSASIPRRYNQTKYVDGLEFDESLLAGMNNMDIYYNILNIVGFRMKQDPSIEITLKGHNSNCSKEKNNLKLSENRAKSIAEYLESVWSISSNRISIESGNLPKFASSGKTPEGNAENRRVEIYSNSDELLKPIFNNWKTFNAEPKHANININTTINNTNAKWSLKIAHDKNDIIEFSGYERGNTKLYWDISEALTKLIPKKINKTEQKTKNTVSKKEEKKEEKKEKKGFFSKAFGKISDFMDENLKVYEAEQEELDKELADAKIEEDERIIDLNVEFILSDETGQKVVKNKTIAFEKQSLNEVPNPIRLDKYAFISFDFGKTDPTDKHLEILELLNNIIKPNSKVKVMGYSDNIGSEKINQSISEKRAKGIAEKIQSDNVEVEAFGESILLYDNALPEGRMYSRTIIAEIQTPFNLGE